MQANSAVPDLGLNDIILPPAPSSWPPSLWAILLVLLMITLLALAIFAILHYRAQRRVKRAALTQLTQLTGESTSLVTLSGLLKQAALAYYPRTQVASLSGQAWLDFLTVSSQGKANFNHDSARWLAGFYQQDALATPADFALAKTWLKQALPAKSKLTNAQVEQMPIKPRTGGAQHA